MANKELTVTRSNDLVESSYYLKLNERRLIEVAIAKIRNGSDLPASIKITAEEFGVAWGIPKSDAFKELKVASADLMERKIKIKRKDNEEYWEIRWVDALGYKKGEGYIKLSFSQHIKPYLEKLNGSFTKYKLLEIQHLKSVYSIRMYELLMQYKKTGWKNGTVEDFKRYFGVEDKYPLWNDFNRYVIGKAIKEINQATNYTVSLKATRKGRSVHSLDLYFSLKNQVPLDL